MSATFISTFIIFGALLSTTGEESLHRHGPGTDRAPQGGPAKASVLASALFGSISGSSVANVMVTKLYDPPDEENGGILLVQGPWRP